MAAAMAYFAVLAGLFAFFALAAERCTAELLLPRRSVWLAAMLASVLWPLCSTFMATPAAAPGIIALDLDLEWLPAFVPAGVREAVSTAATGRWPRWPGLDQALMYGWAAASALLLLACGLSWIRVHRLLKDAATLRIDAQEVVLSEKLGPAVFGLRSAVVILPQWLAPETSLRALVLRHETAHIAARDQWTLLAGLLLVALVPWNPIIWWQLHRLRTAIELDCDHRVLREGADPAQYAEALLLVRQHRGAVPFGAAAMSEPVSQLERRIAVMLNEDRRFSFLRTASSGALACAALMISFGINAPNAQEVGEAAFRMRPEVFDLFRQAQVCMQEEDSACARAQLDEALDFELNAYESAQYWNFMAFVEYSDDNVAGATAMYENVLRSDGIPEPMRHHTMFTLSQLYLAAEQFEQALDQLDRWFDVAPDPAPQPWYLRAVMQYQLERYQDALESLDTAISLADEPEENWYQMGFAVYTELGDDAGAIETLEHLQANWPTAERENMLEMQRQAQ